MQTAQSLEQTVVLILDQTYDAAIEMHIAKIDRSNIKIDSANTADDFETFLLQSLDDLFNTPMNDQLRTSLLSKSQYRYGYQPVETRIGLVGFNHPAPSNMVNHCYPNQESAF